MKKTLPDPSTMPKVECSCDKCKGCCEGSPGWFLPGEAEKAAALLGIPYGEFRKSLIVDYWITSDGEQDVLTPRKQGLEMNRKRASWGYAFQSAPCVFLTVYLPRRSMLGPMGTERLKEAIDSALTAALARFSFQVEP